MNPFAPAVPTPVFDTYWRFAAERQEVFFRRLAGARGPWTADAILREYRFTNPYRAADRTSQYLIRRVIYDRERPAEDVFFRVLLFKIFNKIETWEALESELGELGVANFDLGRFDAVLSGLRRRGTSIYSAAYIMPSGSPPFAAPRKHLSHLMLLEKMLRDELPARIARTTSLKQVFVMLRSYPMMGDFLAFQYAIDLNYSPLTDHSEMDFVVAGPGARDGIRKCFASLGGLNEADLIRVVASRQEEEFGGRGIAFRTLWGRPLQLIDVQNLFCEVDKYARVAHPEFGGLSGRTRIKRRFRPQDRPEDVFFPPKWGINGRTLESAATGGKAGRPGRGAARRLF